MADSFWLNAYRNLYRSEDHMGLNAIEMAGLLDLVVAYADRGNRDRLWALVPVLRDDGAAQLEPLTIARVESYAHLYRTRGYSIEATCDPDA